MCTANTAGLLIFFVKLILLVVQEIESISIKPVVEDAISDGKKLCADIAVGADIGFIPRADASMSNSSPRVESSMSNLCPQAKTSMSNSSPDAHSVDDKAQNISVPINPYCSMFVKGASEFTHHSEKDDGEVNGVTTTGTTEQETPPGDRICLFLFLSFQLLNWICYEM